MNEHECKIKTISTAATKANAEEYDGRVRELGNSFWGRVIKVAAVVLSLFHLYTSGFGTLSMIKQRSFHLALVLFLVYLCFPTSKRFSRKKMHIVDAVLACMAMVINFYVYIRFDQIAINSGILNNTDLFVGSLIIIFVLEGVRRTSGYALPILMTIALFYCYFGSYFPDFFYHNGLSFHRIVQYMVWSTEGIYGLVLGVSSTYLFVFILFGAILDTTGLASVINDLALSLAGGSRGGPAKVAIVASACMGTISGSAVANVATTGTLTIPLMKRMGYAPAFAASVEAIASTGGMIMPPIMGAAALIMAEFLGVPYLSIMKAAILPALLYYFAVWLVVDFEAKRLKLPPMKKEDLPNFRLVIINRGFMLVPIVVLVAFLIWGRTPLFAAFYSIITAIVITSFKKETRLTPRRMVNALEGAGKLAIPVANACASVGIMVGMTGATGLGLVLGDGLIKIAGGSFYLTLFFTMLTCLILGMGLPSSACYIVVSTLAAPALMEFNITGIPVHMFVFYFGILSVITPPVAMASFTAAGIAGENPNKVGWQTFRLAFAGFLIPYVFISAPDLLLIDPTFWGVLPKLATAMLGTVAMAMGAVGFSFTKVKTVERFLFVISAICLLFAEHVTDIIGLILMIILLVINWKRSKVGINVA